MLKGVDISKWQGAVNWDALSPAVDFVLMRMSVGCPDPGQSDDLYVDAQFVRNYNEAKNRGELKGVYHYCYPQYNSPESEAEYVARLAKRFLIDPATIAFDFEEAYKNSPVDWCLRALNRLKELTGYTAGVYINKALNDAWDWSPVVKAGYWVWLAHWDYVANPQDEVTDWPFVAFEQYSNKGNVGGISPVDLDTFNGTAEQFLKYCFNAPQQPPAQPPATVDPHEQQITDLTQKLANMTTRAETAEQNLATTKGELTTLQKSIEDFKALNQEALNKLNGEIVTLKKEKEELANNQATPEVITKAINAYLANNTEILAKGWLLANYKNIGESLESKIVGNWIKVQFLTLFGLLKPLLQKWAKRTKK